MNGPETIGINLIEKLKLNLAKAYNTRADASGYRATLYSERGEYDKAIEGFSKEIELRPYDAETYEERGKIYVKIGEYDKAIADFSEAIKLIPTLTDAYFERAMTYLRMNNLECARQDFDKISDLK